MNVYSQVFPMSVVNGLFKTICKVVSPTSGLFKTIFEVKLLYQLDELCLPGDLNNQYAQLRIPNITDKQPSEDNFPVELHQLKALSTKGCEKFIRPFKITF